MLKKSRVFLLIIILASTNLFTYIFADNIFPDVKVDDWYYEDLQSLAKKDIVQGSAEGYFKPTDTVRYNQYLKMVVVALTDKTLDAKDGEEWDAPYIEKAFELNLISNKTKDYNIPINRYEMAEIALKGLTVLKEEATDYTKYKTDIKDYDTIPEQYKEIVLKAYSKGLITGYTDGTYGGEKTMRRSESVAVIARLIDKTLRKTLGEGKIPEETGKEVFMGITPKTYRELRGADKAKGNDLGDIPLYSKAPRVRAIDDEHNMDFELLLCFIPEVYGPLEAQYKDMEILFKTRFGENNATIKEVLNYVYSKKGQYDDLPRKIWYTNNREIQVWSPKGDRSISIMVWRI